jgi:ubiquinone/menaquinone biosynthesis C-methylase UbiE
MAAHLGIFGRKARKNRITETSGSKAIRKKALCLMPCRYKGERRSTENVISNFDRYQRIAASYDLLDLFFEWRRYRALRPLLFQNLSGRLLDAGVGTGRNCPFYPPDAIVSGIDVSPAMLALAHRRCPTVSAAGRLYCMDVTELEFPAGSFDAAVASFLFCVLPDQLQVAGLRELGRVVRAGGLIRLLEYVRPHGTFKRIVSMIWQPWVSWAYGASFDRETEKHIPTSGLELVESRYVVDDLVKLISARVPAN